MRAAILAAIGALVLACAGPPPTASPSPPPTPTLPRPSGGEPSASLGSFECVLPLLLQTIGEAPTHLTDIRFAGHDGYDRLVFEFDRGLPTLEMKQGRLPFTTDPAGQPLEVDGTAFLQLTFHGASRGGSDGPVTYEGPTDFDPQLPELWQVRMAGDFEGVMTFIVGLVDPPCFEVLSLQQPSRYVIDVAGQ